MSRRPPEKIPEKRPSIDVVGPELEALRQHQAAAIDALDSKAGVILGFSGTILAILTATTGSDDLLWLAADFVLLVAAVGCAIKALSPTDFRFNPKPRVLLEDYMMKPPDALGNAGSKERILADKVDAYEKNEEPLKIKADYVYAAVRFLGIGLLSISLHTLWRKAMTNKEAGPRETSASKETASTPPAEPNPAATNIIKKGQTDSKIEKR